MLCPCDWSIINKLQALHVVDAKQAKRQAIFLSMNPSFSSLYHRRTKRGGGRQGRGKPIFVNFFGKKTELHYEKNETSAQIIRRSLVNLSEELI